MSDGIATITGDPATLFVPMFAPDEAGEAWTTPGITSLNSFERAEQLVERLHSEQLPARRPAKTT